MKYTNNYLKYLDNRYEFINLVYGFSFRYIFNNNTSIFVRYFNYILDIDIYNINLLGDYKVMINNSIIVYINIGNKNLLDLDDIYNSKIIYIINIFGSVEKELLIDKCRVFVKYINLDNYDGIFLKGLFCSNSYRELYYIMKNYLSIYELDSLIKSIKMMSLDRNIIYELSFVKMNELLCERRDNKKDIVDV